jgi:hypothetical protein
MERGKEGQMAKGDGRGVCVGGCGAMIGNVDYHIVGPGMYACDADVRRLPPGMWAQLMRARHRGSFAYQENNLAEARSQLLAWWAANPPTAAPSEPERVPAWRRHKQEKR